MHKVLILGGTAEAVDLATRLDGDKRIHPITSFAGRTKAPRAVPGGLRVGGFGGADGFASYLASEEIFAVIDATHPFAAQISVYAAEACANATCPSARLERLPWEAHQDDDWHEVATVEAAAERIPSGSRIFVTTGRQELAPFFARDDIWMLVRVIDPLDEPILPERGIAIAARGPFSTESEIELMRDHGIEWLVSKNSGGASSYGKIEAARELGLPVIMVRPPTAAQCESVFRSVDEVCGWLEGLLP